MSEYREPLIFGTVTQAEVDRTIQQAHRLRADATARIARAVGKRMRAVFHR